MNLQGTLLFFALVIVVYASYSAHQLKNKVYCTFVRRDKTVIEKWAKVGQGRIEFDGGWYYVNPRRVTLQFWDKGIHTIIPTRIQRMQFRWDSSQALDPETFSNDYEKPEERLQLDKTEDYRAYSEGNRAALTSAKQKKGMLDQLMPIIILGGFAIVGYMLYQNGHRMDMLGAQQNTIFQMIQNLKLGQ